MMAVTLNKLHLKLCASRQTVYSRVQVTEFNNGVREVCEDGDESVEKLQHVPLGQEFGDSDACCSRWRSDGDWLGHP